MALANLHTGDSFYFPYAALVSPYTCKVGLCHTRSFKADACPSYKFQLGFAVSLWKSEWELRWQQEAGLAELMSVWI